MIVEKNQYQKKDCRFLGTWNYLSVDYVNLTCSDHETLTTLGWNIYLSFFSTQSKYIQYTDYNKVIYITSGSYTYTYPIWFLLLESMSNLIRTLILSITFIKHVKSKFLHFAWVESSSCHLAPFPFFSWVN